MLRYGDPGYMEEDNSPKLYAITFSFLGIALLVVALRFFSRFYLVRVRFVTIAEWLMLLCVLLDIASCILIHFQIKTGMGKHIEYSRERPKMLQLSMKVGLAQNVCYQTLVGLIKISICAQFYFIAPKGPQRKVVLGLTAFVGLFTLFTTFAAIFQCIPMKAAWDLDNFPKGCWNMTNVNFFTSSMNTFLDIVIFVLPFPAMAKLQMERKKKFALVITYCVGSLAIACSVVRLRNIVHFNGVGDFTYEASMVPIWGAIETNAGIICASFPFIVPLLRWASGSAINTITGSRSGNRTLMTSGTAHEMQRSKGGTRSQSMYLQTSRSKVPTESTENITADTGRASVDTDKRSVGQVHKEVMPEGAV